MRKSVRMRRLRQLPHTEATSNSVSVNKRDLQAARGVRRPHGHARELWKPFLPRQPKLSILSTERGRPMGMVAAPPKHLSMTSPGFRMPILVYERRKTRNFTHYSAILRVIIYVKARERTPYSQEVTAHLDQI